MYNYKISIQKSVAFLYSTITSIMGIKNPFTKVTIIINEMLGMNSTKNMQVYMKCIFMYLYYIYVYIIIY